MCFSHIQYAVIFSHDAAHISFSTQSIYLSVMATNRAKNLYERQGYVVMSEETCCGCLRCTVGEKVNTPQPQMLYNTISFNKDFYNWYVNNMVLDNTHFLSWPPSQHD